jgi:hypothetical protein
MSWLKRLFGAASRASFHARRYTLLGVPLDTLVLWACLVGLAAVGWTWLTGSLRWTHGLLAAASILLIALVLLQRANNHTFYLRGPKAKAGDKALPLAPEELVRLRAWGLLEVEEKRGQQMDVPAILWITELGDYILMAQVVVRDYPLLMGPIADEGMWYAFINPHEITVLETGTLYFGEAIGVLRLDYRIGEEERTLYLACDNRDRDRLVHDMLSRKLNSG